jgi:hypothetical protein
MGADKQGKSFNKLMEKMIDKSKCDSYFVYLQGSDLEAAS